MRAAIGSMIIYIIALLLAIPGTPAQFRLFASSILVPIIILNLIFIVYGRRRKLWSYVGALVVAAVGMAVQFAISFQPPGPPVGVTVLYTVLPAIVALKSYESVIELRK